MINTFTNTCISRTILSLLLWVISSAGWCAIDGFYVGAGLGPDHANFKQTAWINNPDTSVRDKTHLDGTGYFGSIFGGYAFVCQNLYLAAEVNANASSNQFESSNFEFVHRNFARTKYKLERSFGISFLPGFIYNAATVFYARFGYSNANFKLDSQDRTLPHLNTNLDGFRYGVGILQNVWCQLSVLLDYSHTNYQSTVGNTFDPNGLTAKRTRIRPEVDQFEVGVIYSFMF